MKLATLRDGSRDGALQVVSTDLKWRAPAAPIAATLQQALENWDEVASQLTALADCLESETLDAAIPCDPATLESPLPRAYQFLDGSAYLYHVELVRRARGAELPPSLHDDPLMYQAVSDGFLGPRDDIVAVDEAHGIDMEAEVAVVTGDVPMGVAPADAGQYIRLIMLLNDVSLRGLIPAELAKGFGFVVGKPRSAFSPVAVTPDELTQWWDGAKLDRPLEVWRGEEQLGRPNAAVDMNFDFPRLIAHAAQTRPLAAGTIIGSGTVSNRDDTTGSCCLAEVRTIETIEQGKPQTPFLKFGERVRVDMHDDQGNSIFGAIDQQVVNV